MPCRPGSSAPVWRVEDAKHWLVTWGCTKVRALPQWVLSSLCTGTWESQGAAPQEAGAPSLHPVGVWCLVHVWPEGCLPLACLLHPPSSLPPPPSSDPDCMFLKGHIMGNETLGACSNCWSLLPLMPNLHPSLGRNITAHEPLALTKHKEKEDAVAGVTFLHPSRPVLCKQPQG